MAFRFGAIGCSAELARAWTQPGIEFTAIATSKVDAASLAQASIAVVDEVEEFWPLMEPPRHFLLDLPMGKAFDDALDPLSKRMDPGDILLDPCGGYWGDTLRRYRRMRHRSLYYLDLAELQDGQILAVGGDDKAFTQAEEGLKLLAGKRKLLHLGSPGLAHYALMIEDSVACAKAQAQSEAIQLMEAWPGAQKLEQLAQIQTKTEHFEKQTRSSWLLDDALCLEASIPALAQAVMLQLAEALEEHHSTPPMPRVGGFVHPDELL